MESKKLKAGYKIYHDKNHCITGLAKEIIKRIYQEQTAGSGFELIKSRPERGLTTYRLKYEGNGYFVKNFKYNGFWRRLDNLLRVPYGIRQYRKAQQLKDFNIPAVEPVLAISKKMSFCQIKSTFVSREIPADNFKQLIAGEKLDLPEERLLIINKFGSIWARLFNNNFIHLDPTPDNFLVKSMEKEVEIYLVDLVDIYSLPVVPGFIIIYNIAGFFRHLVSKLAKLNSAGLTAEEWGRFFDSFMGYYDRPLNKVDFRNKIEKLTFKKLLKKNKLQAIKQDEVLKRRFEKNM